MTYGHNENSYGLGFDVVPCFLMKPNGGGHSYYFIPDGSDGWIKTNPRVDTAVAAGLNEKNNTFRRAVKLIKYWNQEKLGGAFSSFYIELAVAQEYIRKNQAGQIVTPLSFAVALGFWALNDAVKKGNLESFVSGAPPVAPGTADLGKTVTLSLASLKATDAWNYEKASDGERAITEWRKIFGDDFGE
jgi:hypothetical protein